LDFTPRNEQHPPRELLALAVSGGVKKVVAK
jgi:hypothetical protein